MYPSDLSDKEWELIQDFFSRPDPRGNPGLHEKREVVNAILYVTEGGIKWRMLPKDFPPWQTVYDHFRRLCERGVWEKVVDFLNKRHREKAGREKDPSYGIIDSQSVKTQYASEDRGIDGGKKNQRTQASHRGRYFRESSGSRGASGKSS